LNGGSFAHFELAPGRTSRAVKHKTIEEIWFIIGGAGQMWRKQNDLEEIVDVSAGVCLTIPPGCHFQFRSFGYQPLVVLVITMPPWSGDDEAYPVEGKWNSTVGS
jgi:mannose-6-phosphate isomerase-like protein (cupin superfamily)